MSELNGVWEVKRTGGLLPPLVGVEKRIAGRSGVTKVGPILCLRFDVVDGSLRYRPPFQAFVDELVAQGDGFRGRATFAGREFGTFQLHRKEHDVASQQLKDQLVKHIDEALAMEQNVLRMLDGMIETTEDPEIKDDLRNHKLETERHAERMQQRLEAHGESPSMVREAGGILGALMKSVVDLARPEKAGRNARDGYATEYMEIASYQLLERIAEKANDDETAQAARENRADEEAMAKKIEAKWDRFVELSLEEQGIKV